MNDYHSDTLRVDIDGLVEFAQQVRTHDPMAESESTNAQLSPTVAVILTASTVGMMMPIPKDCACNELS